MLTVGSTRLRAIFTSTSLVASGHDLIADEPPGAEFPSTPDPSDSLPRLFETEPDSDIARIRFEPPSLSTPSESPPDVSVESLFVLFEFSVVSNSSYHVPSPDGRLVFFRNFDRVREYRSA